MSNKCVNNIYNFIKSDQVGDLADLTKNMSKDGVKKVVNTIKHEARKLLRNDESLETQDALDKASEIVTEQMKQSIEEDKKNARLNLIAYAQRKKEMEENDYDAKKLSSVWFSGREHKGIGARQSFDSSKQAFITQILKSPGSLEPELDKLKGFKYLKDKSNQRDVIDQVLKEQYKDDVSGKIARAITKYNKDTVKLMRKYGLSVNELAGRVSRQYHDVLRITNPKGINKQLRNELGSLNKIKSMGSAEYHELKMNLAFNQWHDFIKPRLDQRLSLLGVDWNNDGEVRNALRETFDKIITPTKQAKSKGMSIADRLSRSERHLFFKDGSSWVDYQETYGAGNVLDSIFKDAQSTAHNLALSERFGANPDQTLEKLTNEIMEKQPKGHKTTLKYVQNMNQAMRYLKGELRTDSDTWISRFEHTLMGFNAATKMGTTTLSVLGDMTNKWRTLSSQFGETFPQKMNNLIKTFMPADKNRQEFYKSLGIMSQHFIGSHRFSTEMSDFNGKISRIVNAQMKWNGLKWWDSLMKKSTYAGWGNALSRRAHLGFEQLDNATKNTLETYNIKPEEWDVWRKGQKELGDKNTYLAPDTILDASDKDMSKLDITRDALYHKVLTMYHDSYRFTVPTTDVLDKAKLAAFKNANPGLGSALSLFMQFKSYAVGFYRNILKRDIDLGTSPVSSGLKLSSTITGLMLAGYIGEAAKSLVKNEQLPNPFSSNKKEKAEGEYMFTHSLLSSLGMYGDAIGAMTSKSTDIASQILGPSYGDLSGFKQIILAMEGHYFGDSHPKKKLSSILLSNLKSKNMPLINTPIAQTVLNYGIGKQIQDFLQPGSYESELHELHQKYGVTPLIN